MKPSRFRHRRAGTPAPPAKAPHRKPTPAQAPGSAVSVGAEPSAPPGAEGSAAWSGDDGQWLARARTAWQTGDWTLLAALDQRTLHRHGERDRLALLAAAGHFQLGDNPAARRLLDLAVAWGCDKRLVARVLVSGLHNTLGRAASLLDQPARALTHFTAAILTASPASALRKATQARAGEQLAQLGVVVAALAEAIEPPKPIPRVAGVARLAAEQRQPAGRVAADPAPGSAASRGDWQCFVVPVGAGRLRFVQRHRPSRRVATREFAWDAAADAPLLGIDGGGKLHVVYRSRDGSPWRRISTAPESIDRWSTAVPLPDGATPRRLASPPGAASPLLLARDGGAQGTWRLLRSDATWSRAGVLPPALSSLDLELDLAADASALHLLAWKPAPGAPVEHAVSFDGGEHWLARPSLPPSAAAPGDGVEVVPRGDGAPTLVRGGGQRWWLGDLPLSTARALPLDLGDAHRLLAADASPLAAHGLLTLLAAAGPGDGAWRISLHDFRLG